MPQKGNLSCDSTVFSTSSGSRGKRSSPVTDSTPGAPSSSEKMYALRDAVKDVIPTVQLRGVD